MARAGLGLAGPVSGIGAGEARLGGDGPGSGDHGGTAPVYVVELLTILLSLALDL